MLQSRFVQLRSKLHVFIQFGTILFILLSGPKVIIDYLGIIELFGVILGLWSIFVMRKSALTFFPIPSERITLIKSGPYGLIRHPMYLALFLVLIPLVIEKPTMIRIAILVVFTINQLLKMYFEEDLLRMKVPEYDLYRSKTKRLIPYIF